MADQDDENEFSDGGLDGLPQSTLQELEDKAISSTQHHVTAQRLRQHTRVTKPYKLSIPSNPKQEPLLPPNPPSSDYGLDDDEDVVDLDESSRVLQPSYAPAQHGNVSHTHALDTSIDTLQDNEYGELHDPMDLAPAHEPYSAYPTNQHGYATSRGLDLKHFEARIKKVTPKGFNAAEECPTDRRSSSNANWRLQRRQSGERLARLQLYDPNIRRTPTNMSDDWPSYRNCTSKKLRNKRLKSRPQERRERFSPPTSDSWSTTLPKNSSGIRGSS